MTAYHTAKVEGLEVLYREHLMAAANAADVAGFLLLS